MKKNSLSSVCVALLVSMCWTSGPTFAQVISLVQTDSFPLVNASSAGLAVDETTVYVTFTGRPEMDTYDLAGAFQTTIVLTGGSTYLGGYTGATDKDAAELYLTAMFDNSRQSAVYRFGKTGAFQSQADITPGVQNTTGIAFDGTDAYVNQNDAPLYAYRVDPATGGVLQTYASNPGHGQRLGMAYWGNGNLLIETYDDGISVLDPVDGTELQYIGEGGLGYDAQTFAAGIVGDTLYLMTSQQVYIYTIVPDVSEIPTLSEWGLIILALLILTAGTTVIARRRPSAATA